MKYIIYLGFILVAFAACKSPEARRPVSQKSGSYIDESIEMNKKLVAEEEEIIQKIIEQDSINNYIASDSGFWYYYHQKDTTATKTPAFGDVVEFDYDIRTLNDRVIYADEEIPTRQYAMDKEDLFSGLREGLKLMKEGEKVTFLFPSHKAFGYYGDKRKIGTNVPIKSTVLLHEIKPEITTDTITNN